MAGAITNLRRRALPCPQVLYSKESIAIVEGLNNDAGVGTALSFSSGAKG